MRRAVPALAGACLLLAPTVLAFFSGGYFAEPQLVTALVVWALVLALAVVGPAPLPRSVPGAVAVGGLALMTAWTALSVTWAPVAGPAVNDVQRLVLYTGALLLAIGALRSARALRAVEPALAVGATLVIVYGLAGRLLPGLVHLARSRSAGGRLEQPITYWNAEGALAAVGLVLCARLAGDRTRPAPVRIAAAAAVVPLGAGVYLTFSRGAIAVAVLGVAAVAALAPSRAQLRACAAGLAGAAPAAVAVAVFPGVASLAGHTPDRAREGAIALALLVALAAAAALFAWRGLAAEARRSDAPPRWSRRLGPAVAAIAVAVAAGLIIGGLGERPSRAELAAGAQVSRLANVKSNRYEYWRVALDTFADHPLKGTGSGGFRVAWLQERNSSETVRNAHSLVFETAAELGLVGLLALGLVAGGVIAAARRALATQRALSAGAVAALLAWFLHASIDWDWQLPAVSLPAVALAGLLVALCEAGQPPRARRGSSLRRASSARRSAAGSLPRA